MRKRRVFTTRSNCVSGGDKPSNRPGTLKQFAIAHENGQNMRKRRVFTTHSNHIPRVTNRRNRPGTLKLSQENSQNMRKLRVLTTRSNRVSGVHKPSKSPRNPNTVCYSPQIMPTYEKTTSFHDAQIVTGGHKPSKSAQNAKPMC